MNLGKELVKRIQEIDDANKGFGLKSISISRINNGSCDNYVWSCDTEPACPWTTALLNDFDEEVDNFVGTAYLYFKSFKSDSILNKTIPINLDAEVELSEEEIEQVDDALNSVIDSFAADCEKMFPFMKVIRRCSGKTKPCNSSKCCKGLKDEKATSEDSCTCKKKSEQPKKAKLESEWFNPSVIFKMLNTEGGNLNDVTYNDIINAMSDVCFEQGELVTSKDSYKDTMRHYVECVGVPSLDRDLVMLYAIYLTYVWYEYITSKEEIEEFCRSLQDIFG